MSLQLTSGSGEQTYYEAAYYKSRIRNLSSSVARDGAKATTLADAVRSCVQSTVRDDNKATQKFDALKDGAKDYIKIKTSDILDWILNGVFSS